jgi:hypothetical protein
MKTPRIAAAASVSLLLPVLALAAVSQRVPVVTQVQGAVFYRTFLTIGNASGSPTAATSMTLTYRSPVDGSLQVRPLPLANPIPAGQAQVFEDIIQTFKDAGAIRAQDLGATLFGTLTVTASGLSTDSGLSVVARTYSPASGGGTNGIAYVGRGTSSAGSSSKVAAFVRNGNFGTDGTTRANIGIVNEGSATTDVHLVYFDATTGAQLKQFDLSSVVGHSLAPGEVVQLNNIFSTGVPSSTRILRVEARPVSAGVISGYAVQLDSVTNDGSFFLMTEDGKD